MNAWQSIDVSKSVTRIKFAKSVSAFLMSDLHWDNPMCDRDLLKKHLDAAVLDGAPIFMAGDVFCLMQGKFDKRANKNAIRPEHNTDRYFDSIIETAIEFFGPYAKNIAMVSPGNHETAVLKRHEFCIIDRFVQALKSAVPDSPVKAGHYSGWVVFQGSMNKSKGERTNRKLWYHHGYGGGGPVTRGVIQTNRTQVYVDGADILWSGHTHDSWCVPIQTIGLNNADVPVQGRSLHIRTAGYKDEYRKGEGGWHIERGGPPKPLGCAVVDFTVDRPSQNGERQPIQCHTDYRELWR